MDQIDVHGHVQEYAVDLNSAEVKSDPYSVYEGWRRDHRVVWLKSMNGFAVTRYDDVAAVLAEAKVFSSSKFWPDLLGEYDPVPESAPMLSMDPPQHLYIRRLVAQAFVPAKIGVLREKMEVVVNELIDGIIERHGREGVFDFAVEFTALFPVSVIGELLGVDIGRRGEFKHWIDTLLSAANRFVYDDERLAHLRKNSDDIRAYFEEVYDRRSAKPANDLISAWIEAEVNGQRLSRTEVLTTAVLILTGGVETTTNLLGSTFVELKRNPETYARVRRDPSLLNALLEETLRYQPPVQLLFRHTLTDTEIGGTPIPSGSLVLPLVASANRDESKFSHPNDFDIDRKVAQTIMTFGMGPHFCAGNALAKMEWQIAMKILLARFEVLMPVGNDVVWHDSYFARGPKTLPVSYVAR